MTTDEAKVIENLDNLFESNLVTRAIPSIDEKAEHDYDPNRLRRYKITLHPYQVRYSVKSADGAEVSLYMIQSAQFSICGGSKLNLIPHNSNLDAKQAVSVRRKRFTFNPSFSFARSGLEIARIVVSSGRKSTMTLFTPSGARKETWEIHMGGALQAGYRVLCAGQEICKVERHIARVNWVSVEIAPRIDEEMMFALIAVMESSRRKI